MKQLILLLSFLQGFNLSAQLTEITPTDLEGFNSFGFFIDINGDDMVISANLAELVPDAKGSLYPFNGTDWQGHNLSFNIQHKALIIKYT